MGGYRKYIEDNIVHSGHPKTAVTRQDRSPMLCSTQVESGQMRGTLEYLSCFFYEGFFILLIFANPISL